MARIKMKMNTSETTLNKVFKEFIISKTAEGLKGETIISYNRHFITVGKYLDLDVFPLIHTCLYSQKPVLYDHFVRIK